MCLMEGNVLGQSEEGENNTGTATGRAGAAGNRREAPGTAGRGAGRGAGTGTGSRAGSRRSRPSESRAESSGAASSSHPLCRQRPRSRAASAVAKETGDCRSDRCCGAGRASPHLSWRRGHGSSRPGTALSRLSSPLCPQGRGPGASLWAPHTRRGRWRSSRGSRRSEGCLGRALCPGIFAGEGQGTPRCRSGDVGSVTPGVPCDREREKCRDR